MIEVQLMSSEAEKIRGKAVTAGERRRRRRRDPQLHRQCKAGIDRRSFAWDPEFYRSRAEITKRRITEKGFDAVAVEAGFPDAYRVNRYVVGSGSDMTANDALSDFTRFPLWMWRNADVLDFVGWLERIMMTA